METEELFRKFKIAIDNEYEAHKFYKDIAERSGSPELKVIFDRLASEEWEHHQLIMKRYKILKDFIE